MTDDRPTDEPASPRDDSPLPTDAPDDVVPTDDDGFTRDADATATDAHEPAAAGEDAGLRGWLAVGVVLAVLWLFVRGVEPAVEAVVGELLFGLVVGVPTAYVFRRTLPSRVDPLHGVRVLGPILAYFVVFLRQLVLANLDVTYRVLAPGPPIEPEVIYVPLRVESDVAVTTIANTITLTPGTITLDHDAEANALFVHVVDGRDLDAVVDPIRTWEDNALTIFGESEEPAAEPAQVLVTGDEAREGAIDEPGVETESDASEGSAGSRDADRSGGDRGGE